MPVLRGADAHPGYSGKIHCKLDGSLTSHDIDEIWKQTGHKAYIRSRKGAGRFLTVHSGGQRLPDALMDNAIDLALTKIREDAIRKITLDDNGRRQQGRTRPPHATEVVITPGPFPYSYFGPTGPVHTHTAVYATPPYPATDGWNGRNG